MANTKKSNTVTTQTVTAQDVATRAGVSRAAVSRTFTNNGSISRETKEKVLKAAAELGYQVNFLAQALNRKRSQLVGLVVSRLSDPFRSSLLEALLTEIQHKGYQALVTEVSNESELESTIRRFTQFRVSGVIVTSGQPPIDLVKECVHHNIPVVGINRYADISDVDFVCSDNRMGAELAATQLLQSGCKKIAWLNYKNSTWSGVTRGKAFLQALDRQSSTHAEKLIQIQTDEDSYEGGRRAAHQVHQENISLDGVFCANSQLACGFLDGMRENGLDAPKDFHIIGFDDTPQTAQFSYRLTTIQQNISATTKSALDYLETRGKDTSLSARLDHIPVKLVLRETSPSIENNGPIPTAKSAMVESSIVKNSIAENVTIENTTIKNSKVESM